MLAVFMVSPFAADAVPTCEGTAATIVATGSGPVFGAEGDDMIVGMLGNDTISGANGNGSRSESEQRQLCRRERIELFFCKVSS